MKSKLSEILTFLRIFLFYSEYSVSFTPDIEGLLTKSIFGFIIHTGDRFTSRTLNYTPARKKTPSFSSNVNLGLIIAKFYVISLG